MIILPAVCASLLIPPSASANTQNLAAAVTWNPADQFYYLPGSTLSGGNLIATGTNGGPVRATSGIMLGEKKYFEVACNSVALGAGDTVIGIASAQFVMLAGAAIGGATGYGSQGISYFSDNGIYDNSGGAAVHHLTTYGTGDVIGIAVDRVNHKVWFRKNGGNWNNAVIGVQNPANNTGGYDISFLNILGLNIAYPAVAQFASDQVAGQFTAASWSTAAPSGFSAIVGFCGRSVIIDDTKYNAYPGITTLPNGHFFVAWVSSDVFETAPGWINTSVSTDGGMTWASPTQIVAPVTGIEISVVDLVKLKNKKLLLTYTVTNTGENLSYVKIGTVSGDVVSWGAPIQVTSTFDSGGSGSGTALGSKAFQLKNGKIILPFFGKHSGDPKFTSGVLSSTDNGLTWGNQITTIAATGTTDFSESSGVQLSNGHVVILVRHEGVDYIGWDVVISTDNGATFGAAVNAVQVTGASLGGRPTLTLMNSDNILLVARGFNSNTCVSTSTDGGNTWATPIFGPPFVVGQTTEVDEYDSSIAIENNLIGVASSQNRHDGAGNRLQFQWYTMN
jgi:BNR repeat-like domain/SPRY domain